MTYSKNTLDQKVKIDLLIKSEISIENYIHNISNISLEDIDSLSNSEFIPYTVFVDSLLSELNNDLVHIIDNFIFNKLIDNLKTFNQPMYEEFKLDAMRVYKDVNFKFKGIINQDRTSTICLNKDFEELKQVLMGQEDLMFLSKTYSPRNKKQYSNTEAQPQQKYYQKEGQVESLLDESKIENHVIFSSMEDTLTLPNPKQEKLRFNEVNNINSKPFGINNNNQKLDLTYHPKQNYFDSLINYNTKTRVTDAQPDANVLNQRFGTANTNSIRPQTQNRLRIGERVEKPILNNYQSSQNAITVRQQNSEELNDWKVVADQNKRYDSGVAGGNQNTGYGNYRYAYKN